VYRVRTERSDNNRLLSIDLEDYFQVAVMAGVVPVRYWPRLERRIDEAALAWQENLSLSKSTATFFVSAWVARMHPGVVISLHAAGHEIAALGLFETPSVADDPIAFRLEIQTLKSDLEQLTGHRVAGFRLARGSARHEHLRTVCDVGFLYDSSLVASDAIAPVGLRLISPVQAAPGAISGTASVTSISERLAARWFQRPNGSRIDGPSVRRYAASLLDPAQPRITALSSGQQRKLYGEIFLRAARLCHELSTQPSLSIAEHLAINSSPVAVNAPPVPAAAKLQALRTGGREAITLVVPCCNEELSIAYLANTLARFESGAAAEFDVHYVFVDDGSTDETHTKLRQHFGNQANAQIVRHATNKGVAAATMTGLAHAPTELVGVIDCDCSYDPAEVVRMIPLMQAGIALVTASPYHPDGQVVNVPAWRLWLSRRLSQMYRVTLYTPLHTYTACVRLYRKSALKDLTLRHGNYLGIAEILARLDQSGARIVESPAVLEARILGHSKMKIIHTSIGHIGLLSELMMARVLRRTKKQLGYANE
jgi:Glycosyl transferase family 2/Polysaccharide deacetylase